MFFAEVSIVDGVLCRFGVCVFPLPNGISELIVAGIVIADGFSPFEGGGRVDGLDVIDEGFDGFVP